MWTFLFDGLRDSLEAMKDPATVKQALVSVLTYVGAFVLASLAAHSRNRLKAMGKRRAMQKEISEAQAVPKKWSDLANAVWGALQHPALSLSRFGTTTQQGEDKSLTTGVEIPGRFSFILVDTQGNHVRRPYVYVSGSEVSGELGEHEMKEITKFACHRWDVLKEKDRRRRHAELVAKLKGVHEAVPVAEEVQPDFDQLTNAGNFNRRSAEEAERYDGRW